LPEPAGIPTVTTETGTDLLEVVMTRARSCRRAVVAAFTALRRTARRAARAARSGPGSGAASIVRGQGVPGGVRRR